MLAEPEPEEPRLSMADSIWSIILYPALADHLSEAQNKFLATLRQGMSELDREQLQTALAERIAVDEIERRAAAIPQPQRVHLCMLAKQIAALNACSDLTAAALCELHSALGITDAAPPRPDMGMPAVPDILEARFSAIRSRFCRITTACSFIPLPFVSDAFVLVPLQVRMVDRIANLWGYPLPAKEFVKMIVDKAGPEYASAIAGRMAISLVPVLGWLASAAITYGLTYAVAQVARAYIEHEGKLSRQDIQVLYKEAFQHGKREFESVREIIKRDRDKLLARFKELGEHRPLVQKLEQHLQSIREHFNGTNGDSKDVALERFVVNQEFNKQGK